LSILLDSLDECNRGIGCVEVVEPLVSILATLSKVYTVSGQLLYSYVFMFFQCPNVRTGVIMEIDDLVGRTLHYLHAFHAEAGVFSACIETLNNLVSIAPSYEPVLSFYPSWLHLVALMFCFSFQNQKLNGIYHKR
jgi:hypothetical protein